MRVVHERCCGLDVHKRTVVASVMSPEGQQVRTFGTMTRDLLALSEWLRSVDVSHVAMESTGVFWQPIYNVLEDAGLDVLIANARHIKAVPGRKTDVKLRHEVVQVGGPAHHDPISLGDHVLRREMEVREVGPNRRDVVSDGVETGHRPSGAAVTC